MSAKEQILLAAERLFAERGLDGVSLRQIGAAAGTANNSAVQYHFQTKDRLIEAIFAHRLPELHRRRTALIAQRQPADLRGWLACEIGAVLTQAELRHSHYLGFLAMLLHHGRWEVFLNLSAEAQAGTAEFQQILTGFLDPLPTALRVHRIRQAMRLIVRAAADRERARTLGLPVLPLAVDIADLVSTVTGFLTAPATPETLTAMTEQS